MSERSVKNTTESIGNILCKRVFESIKHHKIQNPGNPLVDAAQTGVLGGQRRPLGTKQDAPVAPVTEQAMPKQQRTQETKAEAPEQERIKRTVLFTPERAKWLKVRAAMAEKEMSEIVEEALALWEKVNPS